MHRRQRDGVRPPEIVVHGPYADVHFPLPRGHALHGLDPPGPGRRFTVAVARLGDDDALRLWGAAPLHRAVHELGRDGVQEAAKELLGGGSLRRRPSAAHRGEPVAGDGGGGTLITLRIFMYCARDERERESRKIQTRSERTERGEESESINLKKDYLSLSVVHLTVRTV